MTHELKCPECKKYLIGSKTSCKCGWERKSSYSGSEHVPYVTCAVVGCQRKDLFRVNEKSHSCEFHYEQWILKNENDPYWSTQSKAIRKRKDSEAEAKSIGISGCEYFLKYLPNSGMKKIIVKKIEDKKNVNAVELKACDKGGCDRIGNHEMDKKYFCLTHFGDYMIWKYPEDHFSITVKKDRSLELEEISECS